MTPAGKKLTSLKRRLRTTISLCWRFRLVGGTSAAQLGDGPAGWDTRLHLDALKRDAKDTEILKNLPEVNQS